MTQCSIVCVLLSIVRKCNMEREDEDEDGSVPPPRPSFYSFICLLHRFVSSSPAHVTRVNIGPELNFVPCRLSFSFFASPFMTICCKQLTHSLTTLIDSYEHAMYKVFLPFPYAIAFFSSLSLSLSLSLSFSYGCLCAELFLWRHEQVQSSVQSSLMLPSSGQLSWLFSFLPSFLPSFLRTERVYF